MCDFNYKNGGRVITWKIENFNCFENEGKFHSPTFFLETSQGMEWTLAVEEDEKQDSVYVWLKRGLDNGPEDVTLCFFASMSCMDKSVKKNGISSFSKGTNNILTSRSLAKDVSFKDVNIRCHLWIISEIYTVAQRCCFRTVFAAEQRRMKCVIPQLSTISVEKNFYFPILFTSKTSDSFEMIIKISENKNTLQAVNIDIRRSAGNEDKRVLMHCKVSIVDTGGKATLSASHRYRFEGGQENVWHIPCFIDSGTLKDLYLPDDVLTLESEFSISEGKSMSFVQESSVVPITHVQEVREKGFEREKANLRDDFLRLYLERKCTDVVLTAEGKKFPAHKTILSATSPVFSAMFDSDMLEKRNNLVEISDIDAETLDRMLLFMYSENLQDQKCDNVMKLYAASDKYQILTLKDKCSSILKSTLSVQNACQLLILADMHHDVELQTTVKDFICTNATEMFPSKEWKAFIGSNSKLGSEIMLKKWLENS